MSVKVAINGTGRIGLCTARIIGTREDIELVALNTTAPIDTLVHLLRYDSVHRGYNVQKIDDHTIQIGNNKVAILSDRDPANLDFSRYGAQGVIECTGKFNSLQASSAHIKGNVKKVIISAPADEAPTFVYGVNHLQYKGESVISNASCTTNCLAPIAKVLHDAYGIQSALMTTIHSYTNDQNLLDVKHKDIRRARAAGLNMIPTKTGAAKAIGLVLPHLQGKLNGFAIRVPTPDVSLVDVSLNLKSKTSVEQINTLLQEVAKTSMKNIIEIDEEKRVSSDFIGSSASSIFIPDKTIVINDTHIKVLAWYDNEMGYCHRLVDMSVYALTH